MEIATRRLGPGNMLAHFPEIKEIHLNLKAIREAIASSRQNREDRDAIYHTLQSGNMPRVVELYQQFKSSEPLMKKAACRAKSREYISYAIGIAGLIIAIFSQFI